MSNIVLSAFHVPAHVSAHYSSVTNQQCGRSIGDGVKCFVKVDEVQTNQWIAIEKNALGKMEKFFLNQAIDSPRPPA